MEIKTDALLLRAVDYGESDKLATLLTAERGKLSAALKGVKKAGAKLRFAAQPFCFAEYVLAEKSGRHTVISASLHDGFFPLTEDVTSFYGGAVVTEACDKLVYEGMEGGSPLLAAISALKELCAGQGAMAVIRFLLQALRMAGYPVCLDDCAGCGRKLYGKLFFDLESGHFFCGECAKGTPASEVTYRTLRRALFGEEGEGQQEGEKEGEKRALRLLYSYFAYQTDTELKSLAEYIRLL